jgi:hypothetical protein
VTQENTQINLVKLPVVFAHQDTFQMPINHTMWPVQMEQYPQRMERCVCPAQTCTQIRWPCHLLECALFVHQELLPIQLPLPLAKIALIVRLELNLELDIYLVLTAQLAVSTVSLLQERIARIALLDQRIPTQLMGLHVFLAQHVILATNLLPVIIPRAALLVKHVVQTVYLLQD